MKKLLGIIVLGLLSTTTSHSLESDVCAEYAAKAKSEVGAKAIWGACLQKKIQIILLEAKDLNVV